MKYKVKEEFVLNGKTLKVDDVVELDFKMANLKSIQGKIEKVDAPAGDGSVLGTIVPGVQLTAEQKEKLAKENAIETAEAHRLAAEHRAQDVQSGAAVPPVQAVADSLKEKLANEDFHPPVSSSDPTPPNA